MNVFLLGGPANGKSIVVQDGVHGIVIPVAPGKISFDDYDPSNSPRFMQVTYRPKNQLMAALNIWEPV